MGKEQEQINVQLGAMIDKAFAQSVKSETTSLHYQRGLIFATIGTFLLPLLYCLLIVAIGYGIYQYNHWLHDYFQSRAPLDYSHWRSGQRVPRVNLDDQIWVVEPRLWFLYIPMIVAGTVVVFLLRPFLPTRKSRQKPLYEITSQTEPMFYYFIGRLCQSIGVAMPRRIELVMEPKISATFRRGIFSFLGSDLTLTVGLPLISGLTVRQLTGLLVHELGHFRQGAGMRLSYLISCVLNWFSRNIYDEELDEEGDVDPGGSYYGRITLRQVYVMLILVVRLFILMTRGILWLFLAMGSLVGRSLSRQMEYDADRLQIKVAGSHDFETVIYALKTMDTAYRQVYRMNERSWERRVLVNDLPALTKTVAVDRLNQNKQEIVNSILEVDTGPLDAHPCPRDRIAQARKHNLPGICQIDVKSKMLFSDYSLLCRKLTEEFFEREFKHTELDKQLLSVEGFQEFMLEIQLRRR